MFYSEDNKKSLIYLVSYKQEFFLIMMSDKCNNNINLLRESRDFNNDLINQIEDIIRNQFSQNQYSSFCKDYNSKYFDGNAQWLPSIIYYELRKGKENSLYIFLTSTSAMSGDRSDSSYLLCYEVDGTFWRFQDWDTERDSYEKRKENREKYNYAYENSHPLIKLRGYKLQVEFIFTNP